MNAKKIFLALISSRLLGINTLPILAEDNTQPPSEETPPDNQNGETPPDKPEGDAPGGQPGGQPGGGPNTQSYDYSGSYNGTLNVDGSEESSTGETISSEETDKNAILVQNGGNLTIENDTVNKTGDDTDGDSCNFYGVNSIGLSVGSNSLLKINNSSLTSDSEGSNAIFATDSATAYVNDSTISTSKGNSRGLDATYSGTIIANGFSGGRKSYPLKTNKKYKSTAKLLKVVNILKVDREKELLPNPHCNNMPINEDEMIIICNIFLHFCFIKALLFFIF